MIFRIFYIYSYLYLCIYTPSYPHFKAFPVSKFNSETSFLYQLFKENSNLIIVKPCKLINEANFFHGKYEKQRLAIYKFRTLQQLRPLPHNFYLYFNEQIPLWSTWFHSVSVKLCLFEFLPRSHWNDFPFNFFFVWFFSSSVGRYRRGEPNFNDHATWHACAPSRLQWACA